MLALGLYRSGLCPSCRRPMDECTAPDAEGRYATDLRRCHATTALLTAQEAYQGHHSAAVLWSTRRER